MKIKKKKLDWSKGYPRDQLVKIRKFLWDPEMLKLYVKWMGIHQGITAVDVGCGLGYLGYTYWPYFGRRGKYIGIDRSPDLLDAAKKEARTWAKGGKYEFMTADAYNLPFEDNFADWVMCQTLMMHLERPQDALKEMIRILKPGGLIMCKEPDNLSAGMAKDFFTVKDFTIEETLFLHKVQLYCHDGRKKLGRGDQSIGNKIPHMLAKLGMKEIDIRMNDKVYYFEPPYETEEQKHHLEIIRNFVTDRKVRIFWNKTTKEELLTGGGTEDEFRQYQKILNRFLTAAKRQFKNGTFAKCGGGFFYIIKARKPK